MLLQKLYMLISPQEQYKLLEITSVLKTTLWIILGVSGAVALAIVLTRYRSRSGGRAGRRIEEAIEPTLVYEHIRKQIQRYAVAKEYRPAVIYSFYLFRMFCEKELSIRNARTMDTEQLKKNIAGTPAISMREVEKLAKVYLKARNSKDAITSEDLRLAKYLLRSILAEQPIGKRI